MNNEASKNIENTRSQMRKGTLEFCVLLLIAAGKKMYASDILKELKNTELIVVEGTLYPLLNRLKREGLLDYEWVESKNGPPRKYYLVTKQGEETIAQLITTWKSLNKSIISLMKQYE
jgi:PadR family transcriptional regulator, regulatory protein PadR